MHIDNKKKVSRVFPSLLPGNVIPVMFTSKVNEATRERERERSYAYYYYAFPTSCLP